MVPKIKAEVREDLLQNDLKKYRQWLLQKALSVQIRIVSL